MGCCRSSTVSGQIAGERQPRVSNGGFLHPSRVGDSRIGWFAARQLSGDEPAEADVYSFY
jgi:hypothetical protein